MRINKNQFFSYNILTALLGSLVAISILLTYLVFDIQINHWVRFATIFFVPVSLMHVEYFRLYKKRNSWTGRLLQDLLFTFSITFFLCLSLSYLDIFYKIGSFTNLITVSSSLVLSSEIIFSISINLLLKKVEK